MSAKDEAIHLAGYYFQLIARAAGVDWDSDNNTEIAAMIDYLVDAAVAEATASMRAEMKELREQIAVVSEALDMHELSQD
jgi:nucleoid-associated protein YejK